MPVTRPAPGASSRYIPAAARALNSRKSVSGSISEAMRSLTNILPRAVCRCRASSPPPRRALSCLWRRSATSSSIASRLAWVSALAKIPPNVVDDLFSGGAGLEYFTDTGGLEFGDILIGNNAADEDHHVVEFFLL